MPNLTSAALVPGNACQPSGREEIPWVWEGMIAEEAVTLLSAPEKTGKSTLLALLLDRRHRGGSLLGKPVFPGRTIVCSEEHRLIWAHRQPPLDFGPQVEFRQPRGGVPTWRHWHRFIDELLDLKEGYFNLLVIDTLLAFLPGGVNQFRLLRKSLAELRVMANFPAGVVILHQAYSVRGRAGVHGYAGAFADILLDMSAPSAEPASRRRCFRGVGRYPGTPAHLTAELNAEGTDYVLCAGEPMEGALGRTLEAVRSLLAARPVSLTRLEILENWPGPAPPRADSLNRCLLRACELGILTRSGTGTKTEAFRYGVAE